MSLKSYVTIDEYMKAIQRGERKFQNVFQILADMILSYEIKKVQVNGKSLNDYQIFRQGPKHVVGVFEELNSLVSYIIDASRGGSPAEMAFVLVGEPGNGKTFLIEYLCDLYRNHLRKIENQKYTFSFTGLKSIGGFGGIETIQSQTFEDPMILMLNLLGPSARGDMGLEYIGKTYDFSDEQLTKIQMNYRALGACSEYILQKLREVYDGELAKVLDHIRIMPVPVLESTGVLTGKYPAKDKITSSATDLLGEESIQRLLHISDTANPYLYDLRKGALARVAGGGIHFSDEIFKNKKDLVQVYLGVIQNRCIELDGYKWPMDTFIIATSNNSEFNRFLSEKEEAPIIDRCRIVYVGHNTNYKLQKELTTYAIGRESKIAISGDYLHEDPNLNYAASMMVVYSRLPKHGKLRPEEMLKLAAGEVAGEKSVKILAEVINDLQKNTDITMRFGQKGIGQRNLGRAIQLLLERDETQTGKCMSALVFFEVIESIVIDYVIESSDRAKYLTDIARARSAYRDRVMRDLFNAYMDDPSAIRVNVLAYINMIIGIVADSVGPDNMWKYKDPYTSEITSLKIDEKYIDSVENNLGLGNSQDKKEKFRTEMRKIYGQRIGINPEYDFMDNEELVKAVSEVRLKSDVAGSGSLVGALANRTQEENQALYDRVLKTMREQLGYCKSCAVKTIEYCCSKEEQEGH
ncbi:serine protein kinase [Candidatus Parcubacteria bacterium]|nr:MAG: serine protein kinase [Candidatus Parcubacteria bacterium]